jgi:hypothetical protein
MRLRFPLLSRKLNSGLLAGSLFAFLGVVSLASWSQSAPVPAVPPAPHRAAAEVGPKWSELSASQKAALKPLERDWAGIDADRKSKWTAIAERMPTMPADERTRIQARMTEWAQMSPQQRGQVRLNFQEAKQVAPANRQAQWEAYQALPAEQKRQLAARAVPPPPNAASKPNGAARDRADKPNTQAKSNIVPNPAFAAPPKPVGPTVVQARPGATTTLISKVPAPPRHQQTGMPKIAATPEFVDKTTLLPQRGPQGAATRSAAASAASQRQ